VFGCGSQYRWVRWMIIICVEHFFEAAQTGYPETGVQMGTVVEHETGNSTAKAIVPQSRAKCSLKGVKNRRCRDQDQKTKDIQDRPPLRSGIPGD
jgi:hypothetical protein